MEGSEGGMGPLAPVKCKITVIRILPLINVIGYHFLLFLRVIHEKKLEMRILPLIKVIGINFLLFPRVV